MRRTLPDYRAPFELVDFMTGVEKRSGSGDLSSQVMLKVKVDNEAMHTAADGNGPVNALDFALRKALINFYPELKAVRLADYKVRVEDQGVGAEAVVRVLIESADGQDSWSTVGSSENVIEASWMALSDSLEWWLARRRRRSAISGPQ